MAIKRITPMKQIMQYMQDELTAYEQVIIRRLAYCGEECVKQARDYSAQSRPYIDQTGNLRSSTGYVILRNGQIVSSSGFSQVKSGSEGTQVGPTFARQLASEFPRGIGLIVVAGMNYAAYVEAKGYDVLTSSEILANRIVPKMLNKLGLEKK